MLFARPFERRLEIGQGVGIDPEGLRLLGRPIVRAAVTAARALIDRQDREALLYEARRDLAIFQAIEVGLVEGEDDRACRARASIVVAIHGDAIGGRE